MFVENENNESSRILNKKNGRKNTSAKHLRNVLYSKIGLNKTTEISDNVRYPKPSLKSSPSYTESDDISIASETDYNAVETISVLSSSNASDSEDLPKFNPENAPKDLFQVILSCQTDCSYDARKALMYSSIPLSNPILCLIACSANYKSEKFNTFSAFSCWLLASVDFEIRKQFCEQVSDFDALNWSCDENYKMLDFVMRDTKSYFIFLKGLKIFNMNITPLIDLLNFMVNFFCEKNYHEVQCLKSFQDNLWKYEEPLNTDNLFLTKQWIQNASVIILTNALKNAKNYELLVLLRHYDFARIQGSFSSDIKIHDYRKLYRLCQCLSDTDVILPIGELLSNKVDINSFSADNDHYYSVIKTVISTLQQKGYFQEARHFANNAEIESIDLTVTEWTLKASEQLNSIEFWNLCWESLITVDTSLVSAFNVLDKFVNQVSSVVVKCLLVFKCLIAAQNSGNHKECEALETMLWKCVVDIEGDSRIKESYSSQWTKIWSDIIVFMKLKKSIKNSNVLDSIDSAILNVKLSETLDIVIGNLLNSGCIEKAHEVALLFKYTHQDLDIILACDNIAKGLIKNLSEAPLSVQLKTKAIGQLKKTNFESDFTEEQKEKIGFIESISSLASIGRKACQRALLYFKISCVLCRSYSDIESPELDDLELLKSLISAHNSDALSFAKELILLNEIVDEDIASIICKETLVLLKSSLSESSSIESINSSSDAMSSSFLSLLRLLNDTTILGTKLLNETESEDLLSDPLNYFLSTKLYIKAHECFTLACDVKGIALVLRKSRLLITQKLLQSKDFNSILRLMTGIGRYSEMTYCFDILKENNQFELLLSKRIEKVPQLRIALLDYLKGDKEMFPLVALRFCLYREIAENHEFSARKLFNDIKFQLTSSIMSYKEQLENIMFEFIDAQESYWKAGCHSHADSCAKIAQLISLQIHYLPANINIINMKSNQTAQFIEQNSNFYEALIVADAYQHNMSWANAVFNHVILNGESNYLSHYTTQREMSSSFVEEIAQKYTQHIATKNLSNDKLSQMRKSMQRLIEYIDDYEIRFQIAWKLNLVDVTKKMLSEESGAYLHDLRRNGFL